MVPQQGENSDTDFAGKSKEDKDEKENKKAVKYRYFCDACTGIAFFSAEAKEGLSGTCAVCGKPYVTRKENYILL